MTSPKIRVINGGKKKPTPTDKRRVGFFGDEDPEALGREKLASSGIPFDHAVSKLGITFHNRKDTNEMEDNFQFYPSMRIPYFHPLTKAPLSPAPGRNPFYQVRHLWEPTSEAETLALKKAGKEYHKYNTPKGAGTCAYFDPSLDWKAIAEDVSIDIILTEGALKAMAAAYNGFPVIGLGGVNSIFNRRMGIDLLPELKLITWYDKKIWKPRNVYILFDSDVMTNPKVSKALQSLALEIFQLGGTPLFTVLPPRNCEAPLNLKKSVKNGLDDFLVDAGPRGAADLKQLMKETSQSITLAEALFNLNHEYAYIKDNGAIICKGKHGQRPMFVPQFLHRITAKTIERVLDDGDIKFKKVKAGQAWIEWPLREEVERLAFIPGHDPLQLTRDDRGDLVYNMWPGWGVQPKKGNVDLFIKLIDFLLASSTPEFKKWFIQYLAYPLQYPGTKMTVAAVLYGLVHGTGKSLVGMTMKRIYGENYNAIIQSDIEGAYNAWAKACQFVMNDDVKISNKKDAYETHKVMITREELYINDKYAPHYKLRDTINYFWTTNRPDAFFMDDEDRRFGVAEVTGRPLPEQFYTDYFKWLDTEDGAAAIFDYLLTFDTSDFKPHGHAPHSDAKDQMMSLSRSDLATWVRDVRQNPEELVAPEMKFTGDLISTDALHASALLYFKDGNVAKQTVTKMMIEAGGRFVNRRTKLVIDGKQAMFIAIRNVDYWADAPLSEIQKHLGIEPNKGGRPKAPPRGRAKF